MAAKRADLVAAFRSRGLVHQVTDEALGPLSAREPIVGYIGFDPTAYSLHAGSLYPVMLLAHLGRAGHRPIAVFGGGTGMIGDPSGKSAERPLLDKQTIDMNVSNQTRQVTRILERAGVHQVTCLNNAAWLGDLHLVEFLRDVGKHFTVNWMVAKESVRARLEDREHGISFTEFSYMLLQAYDFLHLHKEHGCRLQMGGSDQWGNITAGIELIRRQAGGEAFGLTSPLLLDASGKKFGKSEGGTVWLESSRTSPYEFYQFWFNQPDAQAEGLLRAFTLMPDGEIEETIEQARRSDPGERVLQRRLAFEVTNLVHGENAASSGARGSELRRGGLRLQEIGVAEEIFEAFEGAPRIDFPRSLLVGTSLRVLFTHQGVGLIRSTSDWRRHLAQGSIYLNDERVKPPPGAPEPKIEEHDVLYGKVVVLRRGKKDYALVRVIDG